MVVKKGDTVWLGDEEENLGKPEYMVAVGSYGKEVSAQSVTVQKPGWQVPDHNSAPIKLMCFELFPYRLVRHAGQRHHTVIASGITDPEAGTMVYSIADDSMKRPWLCPLATLAKAFLPGASLASIRVFTPSLPKS